MNQHCLPSLHTATPTTPASAPVVHAASDTTPQPRRACSVRKAASYCLNQIIVEDPPPQVPSVDQGRGVSRKQPITSSQMRSCTGDNVPESDCPLETPRWLARCSSPKAAGRHLLNFHVRSWSMQARQGSWSGSWSCLDSITMSSAGSMNDIVCRQVTTARPRPTLSTRRCPR